MKNTKKIDEKLIGTFSFEFDEKKGEAGSDTIPDTIHLIPVGQWDHDMYGPIIINASDIREFAQNFNAKIRKGVFITAGHEGFQELPAVGWIQTVEVRDDGLWGSVEWNENGKEMLSDKQYKFFSPEFFRDYEDPEDHQIYRNVLTGGALTKAPYFKELEAVVFSEKILNNKFSNNNMTTKSIMAKKMEDWTAAEKAFIKKHSSELTDDEKKKYKEVLDTDNDADAGNDNDADDSKKKADEKDAIEAGAEKKEEGAEATEGEKADEVAETEEQKVAREAKEKEEADAKAKADAEAEEKAKGDAFEAEGKNRDGSEKVQASEKVMITAGELALLQRKANEGEQAFAELQKQKLDSAISALTFSETNKAGKFLPKSEKTLRAFMEKLNEAQRAAFSALLSDLPKAEIFSELGVGTGATEGTAEAEVELKVKAKMSENQKLKYSEALRLVFSENKVLAERYEEEVRASKKKVVA